MSQTVFLEVAQFYETGTFNMQARRSLSSAVDHGQLINLQQATNYGRNLTPAALARAGSGLVSLSATPETNVGIMNGWATNRWRFFFKIVLQQNLQHTTIRNCIYLSGYSDNADISFSGLLDPQMLLVINSRINVREVHSGGAVQTAIVTNEQVLRGLTSQGGSHAARDYTLRPTDILNGVSTQFLLNSANNGFQHEYGFEPANVMLTSNTFSNGFLSSNRSNNSGATHLSRVLNATKGGFDGDGHFDEMAGIMQTSAVLAEETRASEDALWKLLTRITDGHFNQEGVLQWGDLQRLSPNAEEIAEVYKYGGVMANDPLPQTNDSEVWTGSLPEQHMSALIATTLPGLMSQQFIGRAGICITNRSGQPEVIFIEPPRSMIANLDISGMLDKLVRDIHCEIVPILTCNNQRLVEVFVTCDVVAHTKIRISLDGSHFVDFTSPTFADSSFSPIITGDRVTFDRFVTDMANLATNLFDVPGVEYQNHGGPVTTAVNTPVTHQPIITSTAGLTPSASSINKYF